MTDDELIRALVIKGQAPLDGLAAAALSNGETVQPMLDRLVKRGVVERVANGFRLTRDGKTAGRQLLAADRKAWGATNANAALDGFHPLDQRVKDTVTAWQLRDIGGQQVLNDHSDPIYDRRVLGQLTAQHQDARAWLSAMTNAPGSIKRYLARLERALQSARLDPRYIASPAVDSYHGVWFELHEALILLAGRSRAEESAAGRA